MIDWSTAWRGTKLIDRVEWARSNLKRHDTEYCVVYEDIDMDTVAVMHPDPSLYGNADARSLDAASVGKAEAKRRCKAS